jgi:hypothetical protein
MSAFVIDPETMDKVVSTLTAKGQWGYVLRRVGDTFTDAPDAATKIGRQLYAMNLDAVMERYPDTHDNPKDMPGPVDAKGRSTAARLPTTYKAKLRNPVTQADWVAGFKAISCLSYQCSEGDVPKTELFKELELAEGMIAARIVQNLPEYEKAPWG